MRGVLRCVRSSERVWRLSLDGSVAGPLELDLDLTLAFAPCLGGEVLADRGEPPAAALLNVLARLHLNDPVAPPRVATPDAAA